MIKRILLLGLIIHVAALSAQDIRDTHGSTLTDVTNEMVTAAEALLSTLDNPARQSREEMLNFQGNGNHIHTVSRSLSGDFGEDLLEEHYRESPHHQ
jgi:hypothetical protein